MFRRAAGGATTGRQVAACLAASSRDSLAGRSRTLSSISSPECEWNFRSTVVKFEKHKLCTSHRQDMSTVTPLLSTRLVVAAVRSTAHQVIDLDEWLKGNNFC